MTNVLVYDMLDNHCMESEMNERIKEFKESARPEIDWAARYHVELNNGEKEKWMNECVDYAFANGDNVDYLKQYFGVE